MKKEHNCYDCKHRRELAGDAHSRCAADPRPKVKGHEHGIKNGWFIFPYNYDPVWLQECDSFEQKL